MRTYPNSLHPTRLCFQHHLRMKTDAPSHDRCGAPTSFHPCPSVSIRGLLLLLFAFAVVTLHAQTNTPIKEIQPGIFQIGEVRLDKTNRTVSFPAQLNMTEGLIEYLLVTSGGKTHESLLRTEIQPFHLQTAMLLLGAKGAPPSALTNTPPGGQIVGSKDGKDTSPVLPGEPITITVGWTEKKKPKQVPLESCVYNLKTKATMPRGDFTFTGSRIWEGAFIAQQEGSIMAIISDADAMINNPRPGRDSDEIWQPAAKVLPRDTPLTITIALKPRPAKP
jgi:hypothetical protein